MFCNKILLAYDGSEGAQKALEKTIELTKIKPDIQVHVLKVHQPPTDIGESYMLPDENLLSQHQQESEMRLEQARQALYIHAICTTELIVNTDPGGTIVETAKKHGCDLIIIGNRGLSGIKKFILGSVSSNVVNHSSIPVFVVK